MQQGIKLGWLVVSSPPPPLLDGSEKVLNVLKTVLILVGGAGGTGTQSSHGLLPVLPAIPSSPSRDRVLSSSVPGFSEYRWRRGTCWMGYDRMTVEICILKLLKYALLNISDNFFYSIKCFFRCLSSVLNLKLSKCTWS